MALRVRVRAVVLLLLSTPAFTQSERTASTLVDRFEDEGVTILSEALHAISASHAYRDRLSLENLLEGMLSGLVDALDDRNAAFVDAHALLPAGESARRAAGESGIVLDTDEYGRLVVASVLRDSPAERGGVEPGDRLLRIGDENVTGMSAWQALALLAQRAPGQISLTVASEAESPREITLEPRRFTTRAVTVRFGTVRRGRWRNSDAGTIAWITIHAFVDAILNEQWNHVVQEVYAHDTVRSIILDLRDNGGGDNASLSVLADFLPPGAPMVTFQARYGEEGWDQHVRNGFIPRSRLLSYPVALIVNRRTASLAEIFVAALRDVRRAPVIGERTYGKGTTQTWLSVGSRYALHLTVGAWLSPSGIAYDGVGIEPDVAVAPPRRRRDPSLQAAVDALVEWREYASPR